MLNNSLRGCVIAAGGKGTRLRAINGRVPKALTKINGKEVIFDQVDKLTASGCQEFHFLLGYKANDIISALNSNYALSNITMYFHIENEPLGSGGALLQNINLLPEKFIFTYCDIYFDFKIQKFIEFDQAHSGDLSIVTHPNDHPFDSDLVQVNSEQKVVGIKSHPHGMAEFSGNLVNAAFYIVNKKSLRDVEFKGFEDFASSLLRRLLSSKDIYAYTTHELLKDIGTPTRLKKLEELISRHHENDKKPVIFLDRDGTINKISPGAYITNESQLELLEGAAEALNLMRSLGYLLVLVTNQPVIARGELDENGLGRIHARLDYLLAEFGAYLDYKFICPHHPDRGFEGEVSELKFDCECRKPKTGLFKKAVENIKIDNANSWMVGDSYRDIEAGKNFGLNTCLISKSKSETETLQVESLFDFAKLLRCRGVN